MHFEGICSLKTELNYPFKRETVHFYLPPPNNPNKRINRGKPTVKRIYHESRKNELILLFIDIALLKRSKGERLSLQFRNRCSYYFSLKITMIYQPTLYIELSSTNKILSSKQSENIETRINNTKCKRMRLEWIRNFHVTMLIIQYQIP